MDIYQPQNRENVIFLEWCRRVYNLYSRNHQAEETIDVLNDVNGPWKGYACGLPWRSLWKECSFGCTKFGTVISCDSLIYFWACAHFTVEPNCNKLQQTVDQYTMETATQKKLTINMLKYMYMFVFWNIRKLIQIMV